MKKSNTYYKNKIKEQGRTQKWCADQMGISRELLCSKLNGTVILRDTEKLELDKILGL